MFEIIRFGVWQSRTATKLIPTGITPGRVVFFSLVMLLAASAFAQQDPISFRPAGP